MNYRKLFVAPLIAAAVGLGGCENEYQTGEVIRESGTLVENRENRLEDSSGAIFGNDSVRVGNQSYILTVKASDGVYTIGVIDGRSSNNQIYKPIEALEQAIEVGDRIKFLTAFNGTRRKFSEDKIGSNYSSSITVVEKAKR